MWVCSSIQQVDGYISLDQKFSLKLVTDLCFMIRNIFKCNWFNKDIAMKSPPVSRELEIVAFCPCWLFLPFVSVGYKRNFYF